MSWSRGLTDSCESDSLKGELEDAQLYESLEDAPDEKESACALLSTSMVLPTSLLFWS
jgi:hypothetical protein